MPTEQEMMGDLATADKAGDTQLAQHIAGQIKSGRAPKPQAGPPEDPTSAKNLLGAAVEPLATLGTGAVAGPVSGLAGIAGTMLPGPPGQGAAWTEKVGRGMTYEPKSTGGKNAMSAIGAPFEAIRKGSEAAGGKVTDVTGSPLAGTGVSTAMQFLPQLLAGKGIKAATPAIDAGLGKVKGAIKEAGPELGLSDPNKISPPPSKAAEAAVKAQKEGLVLPPTQVNPSLMNRIVEGWGGKAQVAQEASIKNQPKLQEMIRRGLGLKEDAPLEVDTLKELRGEAGKAYDAVRAVETPLKINKKFLDALDELGGNYKEAAKQWPELFKSDELAQLHEAGLKVHGATPAATLELVKKLRTDATANLKNFSNPDKVGIGFAQRNLANAIETLMDTNLEKSGHGGLLADLRRARTRIAQSYDVEAALNDTTGTIDGKVLARLAKKRPLSAELKDVAEFGASFGKAAQLPEKFGGHPGINPLDIGLAIAAAAGGGHPGLLGNILGRPLAAKAATSGPYQRAFVRPPGSGPPSQRGSKVAPALPFAAGTAERDQ